VIRRARPMAGLRDLARMGRANTKACFSAGLRRFNRVISSVAQIRCREPAPSRCTPAHHARPQARTTESRARMGPAMTASAASTTEVVPTIR